MMSRPVLVIGLAVLVAGWLLRDTEPLRSFLYPGRAVPATLRSEVEAVAAPLTLGPPPSPRLSSQPRKCLRGSEVIYTNDASCPSGSREQPMSGGTLTVVPGTPVATGAPASAATGTVRDLAGVQAGEPTLRDRMIERATQR